MLLKLLFDPSLLKEKKQGEFSSTFGWHTLSKELQIFSACLPTSSLSSLFPFNAHHQLTFRFSFCYSPFTVRDASHGVDPNSSAFAPPDQSHFSIAPHHSSLTPVGEVAEEQRRPDLLIIMGAMWIGVSRDGQGGLRGKQRFFFF